MAQVLKEKLHEVLASLVQSVKPRDRNNAGAFLYAIWIHQELCAFGETECKKAWAAAQEAGIVPSDDDMRKTTGESIVTESDRFSCVATVASPSQRFERELFIDNLVKKFKLKRADVEALAERSKKEAKAQLQKRVIEA